MIVGIDLDNTIFDEDAIDKAAKLMGSSKRRTNQMSWELKGYPEELKTLIFSMWNDVQHMCNLRPLVGAVETLREWKSQGHDIVIVTARSKHLHSPTVSMVDRYLKSVVNQVHTVGIDEDKVSTLIGIGANVWIDDAPHQVEKTIAAGIPSIMISNEYTKYNWDLLAKYPGIHRYRSLREIPKNFIESIAL